MDKYEYKVRSEEISKLIEKEKYAEAVKIADTIDWRRVKSASMLLKISALYRINRRNEDSREMLMLAYERYPTNRSVVYSLCELSIELDDVVAAIEYYKQFVKLAPKDNGVYTLRYRILEAQEASLEERIEILEELKKKDYQEEWGYELAYLYHRVGLSTKCVEECDDIILWFGDGPFVMKAMELKAKHVPLTDAQRKSYDIMLGNAGKNYSVESYNTDNYDAEVDDNQNYSDENYDTSVYSGEGYDTSVYSGEDYDGQNYNAESYDGQNYNAENYDGQNYNAGDYDGQNYDAEDYDGQNYNDGSYSEQNYDAVNYNTQGYDSASYDGQDYGTGSYDDAGAGNGYGQQSYENQQYADEAYGSEIYANEGYSQGNYANEQYVNEGYEQENYGNEQYVDEGYSQGNYANEQYTDGSYGQGQYADDSYGQNNFVDDGYGNLSYTDPSYQDGGYTEEFYVEQTYDENGNLIEPELYSDSDYPQENYADNSDTDPAGSPNEYRNGLHLVENATASTANSSDMSQYNTINLQKVVAESMKELFPDDDDVFAEDREKYNSAEDIGSITGDTRIFGSVAHSNAAKKKTDKIAARDDNTHLAETAGTTPEYTHTGRVKIAQMVTGVFEAVPEPHTGAISKVLVPGEDARLIKSDSNLDELRDTTEKSVDDEHNRMEYNEENVYHEQSIMDMNETDETMQTQTTGPMKLDEVLVAWERMKQDNARKHQEEIKKRVLTQTGKIFADFDNSIRSGILGELEREEEEAKRDSQTSSSVKRENAIKETPLKENFSKDGFLEADVTGDIPQQPESDDDFDVKYVTDHISLTKVQKSVLSSELERNETDLSTDVPVEPKDAVSQEFAGFTDELSAENAVSQESAGFTDELSAENTDTKEIADNEYTQEIPIEDIEDYEADTVIEETYESETASYETAALTQQISETDADDSEAMEYTQKISAEDVINYNLEDAAESEEVYSAEADEYADDSSEYTEEIYVEDSDVYAEEAGDYTEELAVEENEYRQENVREYVDMSTKDMSAKDMSHAKDTYSKRSKTAALQKYQYNEGDLDPEDEESIAEMAKEDALKTQEIKMNTADLSSLSEKIVATTKKEARGAKREELREFTPEEQTLFENFAVTKKIKKQIIYALENITLASYIGNVIITGDAGLDTISMAKNLIKEYQALDENFSGKLAKITGEKINQRNIKDVFEKLNNGGIIIEKANGMSEEKLYEMALCLTQENLAIVVIMEDTKKEITKLLEKQAMIVDYFNIRIDLMEMDNNALVAYAKNYALALEYSIDELGTLALYTRIANMQSGNHVVTKDEVRDIIDEAIWKSKKSKLKNFVDVLFARRYDNEDMIVLKERDFM